VIKGDEDNRQRSKQIEAGLALAIRESRIENRRLGLTEPTAAGRRSFGVQGE
jgi:hypothetical protein